MRIGANLITNDTTLSILEVAPMVEAAGLTRSSRASTRTSRSTPCSRCSTAEVPDFYKRFPDLFVTMAGGRRGDDDAARSAPASCSSPSTSRCAWPRRWPRSTSCPVVASTSASATAGTPPEMANNGVDPTRRRDVFREHLERHQRAVGRATSSSTTATARVVHAVVVAAEAACRRGRRRPGPPILIGASAGPAHVRRRARPRRRLVPADRSDAARGHRPAARAWPPSAGVPTEVSAVEMAGQMAGVPWYCDDDSGPAPAVRRRPALRRRRHRPDARRRARRQPRATSRTRWRVLADCRACRTTRRDPAPVG